MIGREEGIGIEQEVFSTKIITEQPKKTFREKFVEFDNSIWQKGKNINFLGIEGMKLLPSDEWTDGKSEFYTVNFFKNVGETIMDLLKTEEKCNFIEEEPAYVVEFSEAPGNEEVTSGDFDSQFDAAPEKFDPFVK